MTVVDNHFEHKDFAFQNTSWLISCYNFILLKVTNSYKICRKKYNVYIYKSAKLKYQQELYNEEFFL